MTEGRLGANVTAFGGTYMFKTLLSATTALTLLAQPALAQQDISPGQTVNGQLQRGDQTLNSGEYADGYSFRGNSGDRVDLRMTSSDFDSYLILKGPNGFSEDNDDATEGDRSAGLNVRLPATGDYTITATSYESGETGRYALSFNSGGSTTPAAQPRAQLTPPARPRGNQFGNLNGRQTNSGAQAAASNGALEAGTTSGRLARGDSTLSSGEFVDTWTLEVREGQTYTLRLSSGDFDPYLLVRGPGGLSEDNDDDTSQRGSNASRITFTASADGQVRVSATTYSSGESGAYQLALEPGDGAPAPVAEVAAATGPALQLGETRNGRLAAGARTLASGEYVNDFTFEGRQGQQLDLRLASTEFDPYVQISGPGDFSRFNDDSEDGGSDSRLLVTLPADGRYTISATSFAGGETGAYRLTIADGSNYQPARPTPVGTAPAAAGGAISIGQTVSGVLQAGDDTLESGEFVDRIRFTGRRGQRVAVELTSAAFDAYTILRSPSGQSVDNDDGGSGGTDSRLDTVLSEDGDYTVSVTSFSPGESGSYRLSVQPSQGSPRQAAVQGGPRVFAVMVGVSDYAGRATNLNYTDEDALKLAESLRREGVLNPSSVTLTNAEATVDGVRDAFRRVAAQAGPDDMFLFFFSGHGSQSDPGQVSAIEPDGRTESISLRDGSISDAEMASLFGTLRTRLSMLVLDSCFSGGFARNVVDRPGVMGLFSSEEDLTSAVADKFSAGGYLAHFLRTGMAGEADADGDRMVTAGELTTYLRRQFNRDVDGVTSTTVDGQNSYQNLVVDRGGVQVDDVVVRLAAADTTASGRP